MAGEIAQYPTKQEGSEEVGDSDISLSGRRHVLNGAELDVAVSRISGSWLGISGQWLKPDAELSSPAGPDSALGHQPAAWYGREST